MAVAVNPYQGAPNPAAAAQPPAQLASPYMGVPGGPHFGDTSSGWQPGPDVSMAGAPQTPAPSDPMAAYLAQFNASLGQSRAAIDTQLKQALGELGQRRDAAANVVAGLPAALKQSLAAGSQGLSQAAASGTGALSQDVRGSVGALQAPLQAALAQSQAGTAAMTPFLQLANMANYQGGEAMLNQQAASGKEALAEREQNFMEQMALQKATHQQNEDDYYNHLNYAHQLDAKDKLDSSAQAYGFKDAADMQTTQDSPAFRYAAMRLTTGLPALTQGTGSSGILGDLAQRQTGEKIGDTNDTPATGAEIAKSYAGNRPLLYALLQAKLLSASDLAAAGIKIPTGG